MKIKKKLEKYLTLQDIILENKSQRTRLTEQTVSTSQHPVSLQVSASRNRRKLCKAVQHQAGLGIETLPHTGAVS